MIKNFIIKLLSILFPYEEPSGLPSVFIQETWLEKITRPTQLPDYLWHGSDKNIPNS